MYREKGLLEVGVGSTNPVKIKAVEATFKGVLRHLGRPRDVRVIGHDVDSGAPDQPIGLEHIYKGAYNRSKAIKENFGYDYFVGLEAGVYCIDDNYIDVQFCVIIDKDGWTTVGHGGGFACPPNVIKGILAGKEVGDIFAEMSGNRNIKKQEGAIGMLSKGFIDRTEFSSQSVLMALIPRISPSYYFGDVIP